MFPKVLKVKTMCNAVNSIFKASGALFLQQSPKVTDGSNELVSALSRMLGIKHFGRKVVKQCILPKQT